MKKIGDIIIYWFPPVLWMVLIFYMSSRPHFGITETYTFDFIIFKLLHMFEYGFLYFLLFRANYKSSFVNQKKAFRNALILTILYSITDEIHQRFVPTREGRLRDVIIDNAGIIFVYAILKRKLAFIKKYL